MKDFDLIFDKANEFSIQDTNLEITRSFSHECVGSGSLFDQDSTSNTEEVNIKFNNDNILKSIGLLSASNSESRGFFKSMADSIANFKNTIKFNIVSSNKQASLFKEDFLIFAGLKFKTNLSNKEKDFNINTYILKNFIYLSYRSGFNELKSLNNAMSGYSTDCGWGCMIRSAQMILAKAILMTKLSNSLLIGSTISESLIQQCRIETILLFSDKFLCPSDVFNNTDFNYYKIKRSVRRRPTRISSLIQADLEEEIDQYFTNKISSPFSIQLISMLGELYSKGAGMTFSDSICIRIFEELNAELNPIPNLELMWTDSIVSEKQIVDRFLEIEENPQKGVDYYYFSDKAYKLKQIEILNNENCSKTSDNTEPSTILSNVSGVLFISIRVGLSNIANEYFSSIVKVFSIQGNLGIIGGEGNKGYYYIGTKSKNELLLLDPHFNQSCFNTKEDMISQYLSTYLPSYVYKINISKISPAFTVGFIFNNTKDLTSLIENFRELSSESNPIIKLVNEKKDVERKTLITTEVDNDFDLIDYEECDKNK